MNKFQIITQQNETQEEAARKTSIDWSKCFLCKEDTEDSLQCPVQSKRSDIESGTGYKTLADNIKRFHELQCLPMPIDDDLLSEKNGLAEKLSLHNAKWHKGCYNKFNNMKLKRAEKRKSQTQNDADKGTKITRKNSGAATNASFQDKCFFCSIASGVLHVASTFNIDSRVRKCATDLQDTLLLAKLSAGDLISQEAVYHDRCLVSLYNRASRQTGSEMTNSSNKRFEGIALAELTSFMEETRANSEVKPVFKLADLGRLYKSRLENLCVPVSDRIHSTELKSRILTNFPDVQVQKPSRDVLLAFKDDVLIALQQVCMPDYDDEAMILSQAAKIICRDILNAPSSTYNGNFDQLCQQDSIPVSLATLVAMILLEIMIQMVDTDVVVLAVSMVQDIDVDELWVSIGVGKHLRYLAVDKISKSRGKNKARALQGFHALTGCDQTSAFAAKGKKTPWETWKSFDEATAAFEAISKIPAPCEIDASMPVLERYVVLLYDRTSTCQSVDDARKHLFTQKGRSIDMIPPTSAALLQHAKRAAYQSSHIWGQCLVPTQEIPCPSEWGWTENPRDMWEPFWTILPQASATWQELLKCGCKAEKGCRGRCKCVRAEFMHGTLWLRW